MLLAAGNDFISALETDAGLVLACIYKIKDMLRLFYLSISHLCTLLSDH